MTFMEFETWLDAHYGDLLAVARARAAHDPEDVLHTAILGMWNSVDLDLRVRHHCSAEDRAAGFVSVWPWAVASVRGAVHNAWVSARRNGTAHLPHHFRVEERTGMDTRIEPRSRLPKLKGAKRGLRVADDFYLKGLEEDRRDYDMEGWCEKSEPGELS